MPETVKLLEGNIEGQLNDIGFGNDFLYITPNAQATKAKVDKRDNIKQKLLYSKGNHKQSESVTYKMGRYLQTTYLIRNTQTIKGIPMLPYQKKYHN